jgi:hypothetical protein
MVRRCPSCSTNWKSIVNFCPECGTDLHIKTEKEVKPVPTRNSQEEQSSDVFKSPILWIFIGFVAFGAAFAVVKTSSGDPVQPSSQVVQGENQVPPAGPSETQVDPTPAEPDNVSVDTEDQQVEATPQDSMSEPSTQPKTFSEPKAKATLTLDAWLKRYSIDRTLTSIQKWSATYSSMNPTQIDEVQTELGDAVRALEDALRYLKSQGSPRISIYDQQQLDVEREIRNYLNEAGPIWIRINNGDFSSREETIDFLAENVALLGKVNSKVKSLLEWLKINSSRYEVR